MAPPRTGPLRLRPGLFVVRRDDDHLQVGLDPPWRVVAPDRPDVRRLLTDLRAGRPADPASPAAHRTLRELTDAGMLDGGSPPPAGVRRVALHVEPGLREEAEAALGAAGAVPDPAGAVALVVAPGELHRPDVDAHVRDGRAHLAVAAGPLGWTIGPFVVPGATACLRCVDAHRGELDPRRALVVDQLAGRPAAPADPVLTALALGWAVRDMLRHLDGERPTTWSATVELGLDLRPRHCPWARHPHCGCAWA